MKIQYFDPAFWNQFTGCSFKMQGQKAESLFVSGKIWEMTYDNKSVCLRIDDDAAGIIGNNLIRRQLPEVEIVESETNLAIYKAGIPDLYISKPDGYLTFTRSTEQVEEKVIEKPVVKKLQPYNGYDWDTGFQNIIIMRHGDAHDLPNSERSLSMVGRDQVQYMADRLWRRFGGRGILVFSSVSRRAFESGLIVADRFNAFCERYDFFGDESGNDFDIRKSLRLIHDRHRQAKTIIIATHLPVCKKLPNYLAEMLFMRTVYPDSIEPGQSFWIDLRNHEISKFDYKSNQDNIDDIPV